MKRVCRNKNLICKCLVIEAVALIFLMCKAPLAFSEAKIPVEQSGLAVQSSDSLSVFHEKIASERTWEKAVNFPGRVLYVPFYLTFTGAEKFAEYIITPNVVQRVIEALAAYKPKFLSPKYSSRHGAGLSYNHKNVFNEGSKFDISGQWGLRERQRYRMRLTGLKPFGDSFSTDFHVWHRFLSDELFYGIGNDTKKSGRTNFGLKQSTAEMILNAHLFENIVLSAGFGVDVNSIETGRNDEIMRTTDRYAESELPGIERNSSMARMQFAFKRITLNKLSRPTAGGVFDISGGVFKDVDSDEFGFWKISAEYKRYIHMFRNRTINVRFSGVKSEPFSQKKIPFYYLSQIGLEETIRGFDRDRYRDRDRVMMSLEYTYPIYREALDALVFIDGGQISHDILKDFSFGEFHTGYGVGFNVWGRESIAAQALVGISREHVRYYFSMNKHF